MTVRVHGGSARKRGLVSTAPAGGVRENLAGPVDDGAERVFGHEDRQAGGFGNGPVDLADERAAAGEDDTAVDEVGRKFWGDAL